LLSVLLQLGLWLLALARLLLVLLSVVSWGLPWALDS
jgi:hypothetical protein